MLIAPRIPTLRTLSGLACAVVPFAVADHLAAEALALGSAAEAPSFVLRHLYLLLPLLAAAWAFARTIGLGTGRLEMIRRCALARAHLRGCGGVVNVVAFVFANLGFFAVTQLLEGDPIASGSLPAGIGCAIFGALLSSLVVFAFGRSLARAALTLVERMPLDRPPHAGLRPRVLIPTRSASATFTLFAPNRPPPLPSFL